MNEYLKYAFSNNLPLKLDWLYTFLAILVDKDFENDFIIIKDSKLFLKIDGDVKDINHNFNNPIININDTVVVDYMVNSKEEVKTTYGRLILNYIVLVFPFGDKVPYQNKEFTPKDIENEFIVKLLQTNPTAGEISIAEYIKFVDAVTYVKNINNFLAPAATINTLTAPDGIVSFKKKLREEFVTKYGEEFVKDTAAVLEYEARLTQYEKEYQDTLSTEEKLFLENGKVGRIRKKMYSSYGIPPKFNDAEDIDYIEWSLSDGISKDKKELTLLYNDIRLGSYSRGAMTAKAGVAAKTALRATVNINIVDTDCGVKIGKIVTIVEEDKNLFLNRYIIDNGKTIELTEENISKYLNKNIMIRTPQLCKLEKHFCKYCLNSSSGNFEKGIALNITDVGGTLLNDSMGAMHTATTETVAVELNNLLT